MQHWEFLIQKQGDRSWLPLESPDVEILEGRYRVVVRSSRSDTDVEVRVVHQSSEVPPKRKVQQRSRRTNAEGLIVVIPFTYLKPGTWELHCGGSTSDSGQNWQYAVHLQVLAQEALLELPDILEVTSTPSPGFTSNEEAAIDPAQVESDDARTVAPAMATAHTEIPHNPPNTGELSSLFPSEVIRSQKAEQILQSLLESIMPAAELLGGEMGEEDASGVAPSFEPTSQPSAGFVASEGKVLPFEIALKETTYIAHHGQSLTISGQVEATTQIAEDTAFQEPLAAGELRICLCNPERGQVISETRQPLMNSKGLPSPFSCTIEIPADCQTQLILGEVSLYRSWQEDQPASASDRESVLATQPFTITAGLEELLGAIASDPGKADMQPQSTSVSADRRRLETASPPLNLALLELIKAPKTRQPVRFQPAANQPLPPLIDPPKPAKLRPEPALPKFSRRDEVVPVVALQLEVADVATSDVVPDPPASETMDAAMTVSVQEDENGLGLEPVDASPGLLSAVDAAFQELKLQYRFWTRLNALAGDAEFLEPLKMESFTSEDDAIPDSVQIEAADDAQQFEPDADGLAQEIVVDDEALRPESATGDHTQGQAVLHLVSPPQTPTEVVVPIPQLEIQRGELVAGQTILVQVQLLPLQGVPLAVKLWIQDCQTRLLLDGPRWIDDLVPDGLGNLESTFDLTVPQGSLEIRFEAIAVDSLTQQESHKVSIDRTVIPPDLPVLHSLDDVPWTS